MSILGDDITTPIQNLNNNYTYPDWYNLKLFVFYKKIYKRLRILVAIHSETSNYYSKLEKFIFVPSILITCLSSIGSFLSTSEFINNRTQNIFGISVGVMASVAALIQSVGSSTRFSVKEESHRNAAEEFNKLSVRVKFEMEMPNDPKFNDKLELEIIDIQNKCIYFSPQFIVDKHTNNKCITNNIIYSDSDDEETSTYNKLVI